MKRTGRQQAPALASGRKRRLRLGQGAHLQVVVHVVGTPLVGLTGGRLVLLPTSHSAGERHAVFFGLHRNRRAVQAAQAGDVRANTPGQFGAGRGRCGRGEGGSEVIGQGLGGQMATGKNDYPVLDIQHAIHTGDHLVGLLLLEPVTYLAVQRGPAVEHGQAEGVRIQIRVAL